MLFVSTTLFALSFGTLALAGSANGTGGCSKPLEFPAEIGGASKGIKIGERIARITLPKNYKHGDPAPLVLVFHDKNMSAADMEETTQFSNSKLNSNSIVVYPEAIEVRIGVRHVWPFGLVADHKTYVE
jgi:poly(3-hydroxybutyrate) depolymerase